MLISQFRFGILLLRLETGRYQNITDNTTDKLRNLKTEEQYNSLSIKYQEFKFLITDNKFYYIQNNANKVSRIIFNKELGKKKIKSL